MDHEELLALCITRMDYRNAHAQPECRVRFRRNSSSLPERESKKVSKEREGERERMQKVNRTQIIIWRKCVPPSRALL